MTRLLLSVASLEEASMAACCGVDVLDLKDPAQGALGALPLEGIRGIIAQLPDFTFSATCGDYPFSPEIASRARVVGEIGIDFIKIGLFPPVQLEETLTALSELAREHRLIAVFLADLFDGCEATDRREHAAPPTTILPIGEPSEGGRRRLSEHSDDSRRKEMSELLKKIKEAGFWGAMVDVADKSKGSLLDVWSLEEIGTFVDLCHRFHLCCGLAGRLAVDHIKTLLPLNPHYLGFRSAACEGARTGSIRREKVVRLRELIPPA